MAQLSRAERRLWEAYPVGAAVDLRANHDGGAAASLRPADTVVRAEVIAQLLLGATTAEPGRVPAVRLMGARITGTLDLSSAQVDTMLVIRESVFDAAPYLVDAHMRSVVLAGSVLPGLDGRGLRTDGALILSACRIEGRLVLRDSVIGGSLFLADAQIRDPKRRVVAADNLVVEGRLDARRLVAGGEIRAHNAQVTGSVVLYGADIRNPAGFALTIGGSTVGGGIFCNQGFTTQGENRLIGAQCANLTLRNATLSNPGGVALDLEQATIKNIDAAEGFRCGGTLRLVGAQVQGQADFTEARLDGEGRGVAVNADSLAAGALTLVGIRATGEISLRMARISGRLRLDDAVLDNPGGVALRAARAEVVADVSANDAVVRGELRLAGAKVGSAVALHGVRLHQPHATALGGQALQALSLDLLPSEPPAGLVTLRHARISVVRDDPATWPQRLDLDGLIYEALEPILPARERLRWVDRDRDGYSPQRYEQLAAMYTRIGQHLDARRVLYAKERRHRRTQTVLGRVWGVVQDLVVAYGYQPWRAAGWMGLLLTLGSVVYSRTPPAPLKVGEAPHFNALVYTLDLLLPIVDLGQERAFNPAGIHQWLSYLLIAAGWVLATTIAAGVARVLSRR